MTRPSPLAPQRRLAGRSLAIFVTLALAAGCSTSATPNPAASTASAPAVASAATASPSAPPIATPSTAATASSVPNATPVAGGGNAAAWCAFVIEINTKYGYMTNKTYSVNAPSFDVQRQLITEALSRVDEWVAKTPPEIKDATAAEILYFQQVKAYGDANGWTDPAKFPQMTPAESTAISSLVPYQIQQCGIKFGK
jgi:hypothetical protein